jgi:hypothetical protein
MIVTENTRAALQAHDAAAAAATLDDLLTRWNAWARSVTVGKGYGSASPGCGGYRASRQYDDANGALDDDIEHSVMRQVDHEIMELADPYRSAIIAHARNLASGLDVWSSPRLPADPKERRAIVHEARGMLIRRLTRAGVM